MQVLKAFNSHTRRFSEGDEITPPRPAADDASPDVKAAAKRAADAFAAEIAPFTLDNLVDAGVIGESLMPKPYSGDQ